MPEENHQSSGTKKVKLTKEIHHSNIVPNPELLPPQGTPQTSSLIQDSLQGNRTNQQNMIFVHPSPGIIQNLNEAQNDGYK